MPKIRRSRGVKSQRKSTQKTAFDAQAFLASAGIARKVTEFRKKETIFSQGDLAKDVLYIQKGGVRLSLVNEAGKEAVVAVLGPGDFFGEGCLAGQPIRIGSATAITPTSLLVIEKKEMIRVLHHEHEFSDRFITYMLSSKIWLISFLIPARSAWRARCCCWPVTAPKINRSGFFRRSHRRCSRKW